jgi:dihydrofolate reductase
MILALIAAHDQNLVIGIDGELPWKFREDMLYFKKKTMGYPVLMGRGVFEEIGEKKLPGRRNIVLTKTRDYTDKDVEVFTSLETALESLKDEKKVFVIGGGEIYRQTIDIADELYITEIHNRYNGDTYFPEYRHLIGIKWDEIWREDHTEFSFVHLKKREK